MAKKMPGIPDLDFTKIKKKKPTSERDITAQSLLRRAKKVPQRAKKRTTNQAETLAKRRETIAKNIAANPNYYKEISEKRAATRLRKKRNVPGVGRTAGVLTEAPIQGLTIGPPSGKLTRYESMVKRISGAQDLRKLRKSIYNRNYNIRKKYEREHPEYAKNKHIIQFPPIEDLRLITKSTFSRLNKIKDYDKQLEEFKKIIINTTRRKNKPKTTGDFSNREQDYLQNGISALREAIGSWGNDLLRMKVEGALHNINIVDMHHIFEVAPSFWAISEGYYYAVADFDDFVSEIVKLIERDGTTKLTERQTEEMKDLLFTNDPRGH